MKEKQVTTKVYSITSNGIQREFADLVEHTDHYSARMVITHDARKTVGNMIHRITKSELTGAAVHDAEVFTRYKL